MMCGAWPIFDNYIEEWGGRDPSRPSMDWWYYLAPKGCGRGVSLVDGGRIGMVKVG